VIASLNVPFGLGKLDRKGCPVEQKLGEETLTKKRWEYLAVFRHEALHLLERSGKRTDEIEQDLGITHGALY
jgi:hypothetical protein